MPEYFKKKHAGIFQIDPKRMWRRYLLAMLAIAALLTISHLSAMAAISISKTDAALVNESGRQRMLSQRILYLATRYADAPESQTQEQLTAAIDTFETSHNRLLAEAGRSDALQFSYTGMIDGETLDELAGRYIENAREVASKTAGEIAVSNEAQSALEQLYETGPEVLLGRLDDAVHAFQALAEKHGRTLQTVEFFSLLAALIVLIIEAVTIFWPAQKQMRRSITELQDALDETEIAMERLARFTDVASDMFWETDRRGRIAVLGGRLLPNLAFREQELIGCHYSEILTLSPEAMLAMGKATEARSSYDGIVADFTNHEGRKYKIELAAEPYHDSAGKIRGYRGVGVDVTEKFIEQENVRRLAEQDSLTGLANRHKFSIQLRQQLALALSQGQNIYVLMLDLDGFKGVNDTHGHDIGDLLLQEVARRLEKTAGKMGWVARLGGDEFVIVCKGGFDDAAIANLASEINKSLAEPYALNDLEVTVGSSIGSAVAPRDARMMDDLTKCADIALYEAKNNGRGRHEAFHPDMTKESERSKQLELKLRKALDKGEIDICYQPIIDLETGILNGFEALARWEDDEFGAVEPVEFVAIAESAGLIHQLGEVVLGKACEDAAAWPENASGELPRLTVNIAPSHFVHASLAHSIRVALKSTGLDPSRLELEITDSIMLENPEAAMETLTEISKLGIGLSMDDFGTGYSSLNRLRMLPLNRVKIDHAIVRELATDRNGLKIVRGIISLAKDFDIGIVAEGVENERQVALLEAAGCDEAQGHFFSIALSLEDVVARLQSNEARHAHLRLVS